MGRDQKTTNIEKHGVSFVTASRVFEGRVVTFLDNRCDYGEQRKISIGQIDGVLLLTVIHTDRTEKIRIISARRANGSERKRYEEEIR